MNIEDTLAPKSDQLDAIELIGGPRTFTIKAVSRGTDEQPVNVTLEELDRPWRPSKGMRRVLAKCWGLESAEWVGRRVELFYDPEVTFGKETPGGTRISRLSHIDKRMTVPLVVSRGKSRPYPVEPLPDKPAGPTADDVAASTNLAVLRTWWKSASGARRAEIEARVAALETGPTISDDAAELFGGDSE